MLVIVTKKLSYGLLLVVREVNILLLGKKRIQIIVKTMDCNPEIILNILERFTLYSYKKFRISF